MPDVNKQRRKKQTEIYRTENLQISICRDKASKVKATTETLYLSICRKEASKINWRI